MKKKTILNLIKYHTEKNEIGFKNEAYTIAKDFDSMGDYKLAEYILSLISDSNVFVPQEVEGKYSFLRKLELNQDALPLPDKIMSDVIGLVNAVGHNAGINKFLFQGAPGTGKTETAKQIARLLKRELYIVDFEMIIDSKLGQTSKNISLLFKEINSIRNADKVVVLFDEIDSIALDRTNSNDLREMGRATSSVLKALDTLNDEIVLIATTNLFNYFDKALVRRFDFVVDFNRYTREDLLNIADILMNNLLNKFKFASKNKRIFKKIMNLMEVIPYPGELKNLLKAAIAFSKPGNEFDYLRRLYSAITKREANDLKQLQSEGFTMREIEILTGISKSKVSRDLKE